jgi:hypothetical protein
MSSEQPASNAISLEQFKQWGALGGAKVTGKKKKRSAEHYRKLSAIGVAARAKKREVVA